MDKILSKDYQNNLLDFLKEKGVEEKDAIEFIKEKYHAALKEAATQKICQFLLYIENYEYDRAEDMIYRDGNHSFLSFCDISYGNDDIRDIWGIIQELKNK